MVLDALQQPLVRLLVARHPRQRQLHLGLALVEGAQPGLAVVLAGQLVEEAQVGWVGVVVVFVFVVVIFVPVGACAPGAGDELLEEIPLAARRGVSGSGRG